MASQLTAEPVLDIAAQLGEGPVWDGETGTLLFIDILGRRIFRWHPGSQAVDTMDTPSHVRAVRRAGEEASSSLSRTVV